MLEILCYVRPGLCYQTVITIAAENLVTKRASASVAMVLTYFYKNIADSAQEGLTRPTRNCRSAIY